MKLRHIDHVSLHVRDVGRSAEFYRGVLQLEPIPRPAFPSEGAWFRIGATQLHVIGGRTAPVRSAIRGTHFAIEVDELNAWEIHLRGLGIEFTGPVPRPDGATQVFLEDPDGYVVELFLPPARPGGASCAPGNVTPSDGNC